MIFFNDLISADVIRRIAFGLVLLVTSSCTVRAQSKGIEPLVGTWHSVEDRCAADEGCADSANEAQLVIYKSGKFQWVQYRDFKKSDVCSWAISPDAPGLLDYDDCGVDTDQYADQFVYQLSGKTLVLTGFENDPTPREVITMRFERGPLIPNWREPRPEICNSAPLP